MGYIKVTASLTSRNLYQATNNHGAEPRRDCQQNALLLTFEHTLYSIRTYFVQNGFFLYMFILTYPAIRASIPEQQFGAPNVQFICKNVSEIQNWILNVYRLIHPSLTHIFINDLYDLLSWTM